jgi:O-antigen ligase
MSRRVTDYLAIAIAISLPWSTTATGALLLLWLLAALPTADVVGLRREILTPAGGLPLLLCAWAMLGILWATDVSWKESFAGLREFHKLLLVPVFLAYFARSSRNLQTVIWFFISCVVLLILSFVVTLWPRIQWWHSMSPGVPFKSYITQSAEFTISAFFFFYLAADAWKERARIFAAFTFCLGLAFIGNVLFIATSRTELIVIGVLMILFGAQRLGWKGALAGVFILSISAILAWNSSSYLRGRVDNAISEIQMYRTDNQPTSLGLRLEFWRKSIEFISEAPLFGHGTGSIKPLFQRAATGETGTSAAVTSNPHNQIFAVAIQLGLIGVTILLAMWLAHLWMFLGPGLLAWIGLTVIVQNIIGSIFFSHLFDFAEGWIYVCFVGVLGRMQHQEIDIPRFFVKDTYQENERTFR